MEQVKLFYGWQETENGIFHSFEAVDPIKKGTGVEQRLAESLDTNTESADFNWDWMYVNLPESLIQRIKRDAVAEYIKDHATQKT